MAIINNIRKYSTVAIFFVGIAIASFVLADLFGGGKSGSMLGGGQSTAGVIDGEKIPIQQYTDAVEALTANYRQQTGQSPEEAQLMNLREQAWNNFLFDISYQKEFEKLGIKVSSEELTQMVQGDSIFIHPWVRQQFVNPQTQQFDKALVVQQLQYIGSNPQMAKYWENFENQMVKNRLQTKYEDLFRLSAYVTQAEAERQHSNQNTKAQAKYLYVPFTSIVDSTLKPKVTDAKLQEYLSKNKNKYKAEETRSIEYIVFDIKPSKEDSLEFYKEIKQIAKELATSTNDSLFVLANSANPAPIEYQSINSIPTILFDKNPTILKGGIYGPYIDGKSYKIFKVSDVKEDSVYYTRARHILFKADTSMTADVRAKARKDAEEVLQKIKDGADFAAMARQYGSDGTSAQGGDLGWFSKGQMVAPFENAVFARENPGLISNIVETSFGYHIVDVTQPKNNKQYKLAIIENVLDPSEDTRNDALLEAEELKSNSPSTEKLRENIKKKPNLVILKADKLPVNATSVGGISGAREIIRWAFNDAKINDVSEVFDIQEQNKFVLATLTGKTSKDESNINLFREELTAEVIKELKAEEILKKLDSKAKSLDAMAKKYGEAALVNTVNDLALNTNVFENTGFNPKAVGKTFGLQKGKRTEPFADETGVFVIELTELIPAAKIADYSQSKNQLQQGLSSRVQFLINEAIRKFANIKDERYKFY